MFKMIFVFCVIAAVLHNLNCKPLASYQTFVKAKCKIPPSILKTKYPGVENENQLFERLQICENPDTYFKKLCDDLFAALLDISTCNRNLIPKDNLNFDSSSLPPEKIQDTCKAFANQKFSKLVNKYPSYNFLKVKIACDFFCSANMELCNVLLWAYNVQDVLLELQDTLENQIPSITTANNGLSHVSSVTPTITQLVTSKVNTFPKEVTPIYKKPKEDSAEHKLSNESRNLFTENSLKSKYVNLTKALVGTRKQIVTSASPSVTSASPSANSVNASVTSAGLLLVTHTTSQAGNNVTLFVNLPEKNDMETKTNKIKETGPNASSKSNEQNTNSFSKSITYKTPSSVKEEFQSLPTISNKNLFNGALPSDESFTGIDFEEDENTDYGNSEIEINDNNKEENKLSSSKEEETVSRNSAKTSSTTHMIAEAGSKAQELKANSEDFAGTVQSTKPEEKPDKSLAPEDTAFDSNDKVSKVSAPDEKYITEDYSLPEVGSGKHKSNMPASKFTESTFLSKNQNMIPEVEDPQFFFYFLSTVLLVATCYVLYHNKQKIIALIVEGCHERRRRPLGVNYRKLETKQ